MPTLMNRSPSRYGQRQMRCYHVSVQNALHLRSMQIRPTAQAQPIMPWYQSFHPIVYRSNISKIRPRLKSRGNATKQIFLHQKASGLDLYHFLPPQALHLASIPTSSMGMAWSESLSLPLALTRPLWEALLRAVAIRSQRYRSSRK